MDDRYTKLVTKATYCAVSCSLFLIAIKVLTWWITGSMSLFASLLDSSIDLLASGMSLILVRYSLKPADETHAFGHGKAESLAALAQSAFIVGSAVFLLLNGIKLLMNPIPVEKPLLGIVISLISIAVTLCLLIFQRYVVKKTDSTAIKADMLHYSSDLLMNFAVVLALILSWFGIVYADVIFALLIGTYIFYSALKIAKVAILELLDTALPESDYSAIADIVSSFPNVHGVHDIKTRKSGPMTFIQLHIELDDHMSLFDAHYIADRIEDILSERFEPAEVIVHQDPISVLNK